MNEKDKEQKKRLEEIRKDNCESCGGLTKREYFAAKVLPHFVGRASGMYSTKRMSDEWAVARAVEYADALIAALEGKDDTNTIKSKNFVTENQRLREALVHLAESIEDGHYRDLIDYAWAALEGE